MVLGILWSNALFHQFGLTRTVSQMNKIAKGERGEGTAASISTRELRELINIERDAGCTSVAAVERWDTLRLCSRRWWDVGWKTARAPRLGFRERYHPREEPHRGLGGMFPVLWGGITKTTGEK